MKFHLKEFNGKRLFKCDPLLLNLGKGIWIFKVWNDRIGVGQINFWFVILQSFLKRNSFDKMFIYPYIKVSGLLSIWQSVA